MARISQYEQDGTLNKQDKVLGTDSATGATKNYTIDSILSFVNTENLVEIFDGAAYTFQSYVDPADDPEGVINLNGGGATDAAFSAINTIFVSVKDGRGQSLAEYFENADNDFIKISKTDNLNQFGIYEVIGISDHGNSKYKRISVTPRGTNGTLTVGQKYFVANYSALYDQDFSDDSVTEFSDVESAGSGQIITAAERTALTNLDANALVHNDVVNNVTSTATDVPLSANQGRVLKNLIDAINNVLDVDAADEGVLDNLRDIVNYVQTNRDTLNALGISSISGLQAALNGKQNTESGKGLSANDFTDLLLQKLNGIAAGAQVNVKPNWSAAAGTDAEILNKPTDLTNLGIHDVTELRDVTSTGSGAIITDAERNRITSTHSTFIGLSPTERAKLTSVETNADVTDTANVIAALTPGTNISIETDGTINATDTNDNTTYDLTVAQSGDNAQISLEGSDNVDDNLTLVAGNNVDLTVNSGNTTIDVDLSTGAVADGATTLVTGDQVFDYTANFARKDQEETFSNNVTIQGNLTVSGSTTTVNSNQLNIADNIITLNSDLASSVAPTQNAGIEVNRGSSSTVAIRWDEGNDAWQFTNDGTTYENINADHPINDLTDVNITNLQNNQVLKYNSTTSKWENQAEGGSIDGTGVANKLAIWSDTDSLTNDTNLHWDTTNDRLGIGTATPAEKLEVDSGSVKAQSFILDSTTELGKYYSGTTMKIPDGGYFSVASSLNPSVANLESIAVKKIAVGKASSDVAIDAGDNTDAIVVPKGTDAQRNALTAVSGMLRFNTTDNEFEGYDGTEWGAIGGASGGGSGEIVKKTFNGGVSAYVLDDTIADIDNVQVFVDGVYQYPSNYTVSGNTVTFVTGSTPGSGTNNVHIVHNVTVPTLTQGAAMSTSTNLVGDGNTTSFALGGSPRSSEHMMVFLNGVYQEKTTYTLAGSNINFNTAPPSGYTIEVKYVTGTLDLTDVGQITLDELTGNGGTTYALSATPQTENYTNVYIEGVYQEKGTYQVSGSNIVFSSNVPTGYSIEVSTMATLAATSVTPTTFETDTFTANGTNNNFTLVNGSPSSKALTMVFIQGVYQAKSKYNLASGQIQFTGGTPAEDDVIEVISISAVNTAGSPVTSVNGEVGAVTVQSKHNVSVISANTNAVANTVYVFTASLTLTLPASPSLGDSIKISNLSDVATCVLGRNGNKIMGDAADLTLDTASASFELIWSGAAKGWVIIGQ